MAPSRDVNCRPSGTPPCRSTRPARQERGSDIGRTEKPPATASRRGFFTRARLMSLAADRLAEAFPDGRGERGRRDGRADRGLLVLLHLGLAGAAVRLAPGDQHLAAGYRVR